MELQWPLIIFTTLVAWSAGLFGAQALLAFGGEGKRMQMPALIMSVAILAVSGIAVFFHLEHWERIFNGFGHITSGITQELIAVVVFVVVAVVYFAALRKSEDGGTVPKWLAVVAIVVSTVLALVCAHSYMMAARPAWNTVLWLVAFLGEAVALGTLTAAFLCALRDDAVEKPGLYGVVGAVASAVATLAYGVYWQASGGAFTDVGYSFDPTTPTVAPVDPGAAMNVFAGSEAALMWIGVILVGVLLPVGAAFLGKKKGDWKVWGAAGAACAVVGCVCLRVVFYNLGSSVFMFY